MHEARLQYSHLVFVALRSALISRSSIARRFRRSSSASSNSLKPPASPVRFAPG
jgi:hypothetical protein